MDRKEILNDCDEDLRLLSKHGSVEFLTTIHYIEKYLKEGFSILEVGAGTGRYSLYFADKGYKVNSIDFVEHNINILKSHIKDGMDINAEVGDALDLSRFDDNHLYTDEDVNKAVEEAIRVTKKDGILAFAYLTNDSIMISYALKKDHLIDGYNTVFDENFKIVSVPEEVFRAFYIDEFNEMMKKYNVDFLHSVATDGMSEQFKEKIDSLNDKEFEIWMKYHLSSCERKDLQGYSNHMLYLCKKK